MRLIRFRVDTLIRLFIGLAVSISALTDEKLERQKETLHAKNRQESMDIKLLEEHANHIRVRVRRHMTVPRSESFVPRVQAIKRKSNHASLWQKWFYSPNENYRAYVLYCSSEAL